MKNAVSRLFGLGLISYGEALFLLGERSIGGDAYFDLMERLEALQHDDD